MLCRARYVLLIFSGICILITVVPMLIIGGVYSERSANNDRKENLNNYNNFATNWNDTINNFKGWTIECSKDSQTMKMTSSEHIDGTAYPIRDSKHSSDPKILESKAYYYYNDYASKDYVNVTIKGLSKKDSKYYDIFSSVNIPLNKTMKLSLNDMGLEYIYLILIVFLIL